MYGWCTATPHANSASDGSSIRFERGVRHACFEDHNRIEHLQAGGTDSAWDRVEPLQVNLPTLVVETSDGYTPDLDQIIAFAQRRLL